MKRDREQMMAYDNNNVFAKILRGEIPCTKVYEDELTLAFMDIMPQAEGHTLVVPKEPAVTLLDLSPEGAANAIQIVQKMANAVKKALDAPGFTLMQLNGPEAGQTVPHIHFHIIPRHEGVTLRRHADSMESPDKLKVIADKIKAQL